MRRTAIGSIAIVLLASLQCEPQETKAGPLTSLSQTSFLVEPLDAEAKALGLSIKSLESQILVGLRRDIPTLAIRESAIPYLYLNVIAVQARTVGGQDRGFAAYVVLRVKRPATILTDWGIGDVVAAVPTVWERGVLLLGGRNSIRRRVKDSIDELLTEFAADYYRQNPP